MPELPPIPVNVMERNDVIACLLGRALRDAHFKLFASLLRSEREYPIFYSEAVLRLMASRARKTPSLAKVLLERSVSERSAPTSFIAEHFLQIIRASNAWSISEAVGISHEGICSACGHPLNQREELNEDEHWALHKALLSFLECGTKNFSSGSPAEVRALRNHVRGLPKAEGGTKSLVVDTLNLIHGRSIEPFYKMLLALMEDFPRIMLITRPGSKNRFIRHLSPLNISVFVCNKLSFLECGTKNFSSGSPAEVRALRNHVRGLPKAEGGTKSLVVDTLNLIHGRSIEPFYKMLLALMEDFPRIMLITRPGSKNRFIRHLSPLNISVFVCNKLSEDDLFILLAALEMGPGCYVLTNDQFSDHRHRLGHDLVPLFDRWNESRVVRYFASTYRYKMPGRFTCFPHRAPDGFHIPVARVIAPSIYEHDWICVVKKHVSRRK
ncbi:hypothetical protein Tcan_07765 [Toxocara canis]|uniref:PRORP domain-containing protein n=1 Tax=Toxocara canis TaxID=6265 RepID=A0A0B2W153_TOXCA|nr:hypothetical protein Tcan_07765 [Toxocara canis]